MKILLCGFGDLVGADGIPAPSITPSHLPFPDDVLALADVVAVYGDGRVLILKNRLGPCGPVSASEFLFGNSKSPGPFG